MTRSMEFLTDLGFAKTREEGSHDGDIPQGGSCQPLSVSLQNVEFAHPSIVMSADGQPDGKRERGRPAKACPEDQFPILDPFATQDAETENRSEECHDLGGGRRGAAQRHAVLAKKNPDPCVVKPW